MINSDLVSYLNDILNQGIKKYGKEFLIGFIELDDELYEEVVQLTSALINKKIYLYKNNRNMIISFALINFAIKDYKNNQFWNEFAAKLECDSNEIMKVGKKAIESFCSQNDLYFHIGNSNKGFVTTILTHAIIPNSVLSSFIEFLQDIYFKDLEEDYIDQEVAELLQYMHRLFSKYLNEEEIKLIVKDTKMTIARQQLPKSFRIAYVKSPKIVKQIIERLLFYIDQRNYGQIVEYLENDRFDLYFKKNIDILSNENKIVSNVKQRRSSRVRYFSVVQYYYDRQELYLQLPSQIIESDYVANTLYAEIMFGNEKMLVKKLILTKSRLLFKTEKLTIKLPKFHKHIRYRIISGDSIVYDSQKTLYRDFIIFNSDGNEIQPKNLTDEKIKIISSLDSDIITDDAELIVNKKSDFKITTVFMNEESLLLIDDKVFSTNVAKVRSELSKKYQYKGILIEKENIFFQVYLRIPEIKLRIRYKKNINDYIICINNYNYSINEVSDVQINEILDGSGDSLAKIKLHNSFVTTELPLEIIIREKGSKRTYLEEKIFIINSLLYSFDKNYYYKEEQALITEFNAPNMELSNEGKLPITINIRKNKKYKISVLILGERYNLIIKIPILSWKLSNITSETKYSENIWYEDISDYRLFVEFPYNISNLSIVSPNSIEKIQGKIVDDSVRFSLEQFIQYSTQDYINLNVMVKGNKEKITSIHFKPKIMNFFVSYYDKSQIFNGLVVRWKFYGRGKLFVDVIYSANSKVIKSYQLEENENIMDGDLELYYGEYEIEIYQMKKNDFFAGEPEKEVLLHNGFIVGDPVIVKCKNRTLEVTKCISNLKEFDIGNFYLKDIDFSNGKGNYKATGFYYIYNKYTGKEKKWYFTKYNPFILKKVAISTNEIEFEIVDKEGDGLIYDVKTTHVNPKDISRNERRFKLIDRIKIYIYNKR